MLSQRDNTGSMNAARLLSSMNNHIFPIIGHVPVRELKTRHFIDLLKEIEKKGLLEVAARTRQHMCNIMRYSVHQELIEHNPRQIWTVSSPLRLNATNGHERRRRSLLFILL